MGRRAGAIDRIKGRAKVANATTGTTLKVTFFWPFYAPYWIVGLGKNYEYAVVGTPSRKYLWILSRTPDMDDVLYESIVNDMRLKGFDVARLMRSVHTKNK